jgi:hypothetical protein
MVCGYRFEDWGSILDIGKLFSFHHCVHTGYKVHPASYLIDEATERKGDRSSSSDVELKNSWSCTSTLPYTFMA